MRGLDPPEDFITTAEHIIAPCKGSEHTFPIFVVFYLAAFMTNLLVRAVMEKDLEEALGRASTPFTLLTIVKARLSLLVPT